MKAETSKFSDFFGRNGVFTVPFFQRSYVWREEQWERCLRDAEIACRNNVPHFMGALIFKKGEMVRDSREREIRIIDGQQRFTTIVLLVKALADKLNGTLPANFMRTAEGNEGFKHNCVDDKEFNSIVYNDGVCEDLSVTPGGICNCYRYFYDNITEECAVMTPEDVARLFNFVVIQLESGDDEQEIFETINSIGVDLTAGELLKNELFRSEEIDYYAKTWGKTFESPGNRSYWEQKVTNGKQQSSDMMNLFLRSYYAVVADLPSELEALCSLFKNYQRHLKKCVTGAQRHLFIEDMIYTAEIFKATFDPHILNMPRRDFTPLQRLSFICFAFQQMTVIPYILYVIRHAEESEKDAIFALLETYLMRRRICDLTTGRYNLQFRQFIKKNILTYKDLLKQLSSFTDLTSMMPCSFVVFSALVEGSRNMSKNKLGAVLLYFMEHALQKRSGEAVTLKAYSDYHMEYLIPKKYEKWRNEALCGVEEEAIQEALEKLGNFTLVSPKLPSALSSEVWSTKLKGNGNNGLSVCCKGLKSMSPYLSVLKPWDISQVEKRTMDLAILALEIWSYELDDDYTRENLAFAAELIRKTNPASKYFDHSIRRRRTSADSEVDTTVPHLLTESMVGHKLASYIFMDEEYPCFTWKTMFSEMGKMLLEKFPQEIRACAREGRNRNISKEIRYNTTMPERWQKLGEECYIYNNLGEAEIRRTLLYMLECAGLKSDDLKVMLSR